MSGTSWKFQLLLVILLALLFRAWNLESIPHWYWDEGANMNLAWNLSLGEMRMFAMRYFFVPHPPLYFLISALTLRLFGNELVVLRMLSVVLSGLTAAVVYLVGRELKDEHAGMLAGFLFAIYPVSIYWTRMAFANVLLMFLGVLCLYFFLKNKIYLSCLCAGLASVTQLMGLALLLTIFMLLLYGRKRVVPGMLVALAPFAAYFAIMMHKAPRYFIFDWKWQLGRYGISGHYFLIAAPILALLLLANGKIRRHFKTAIGRHALKIRIIVEKDMIFTFGRHADFIMGGGPMLSLSILNALGALYVFRPVSDAGMFVGEGYYWIGMLGLFLSRFRLVLLSFFVPLLLFSFRIAGRTDHMVMPLYPFLFIGMAVLLPMVYDSILRLKKSDVAPWLALLLVYYPLLVLSAKDINAFVLGNGIEAEAVEDYYIVSEYVNNNNDGGVVIGGSHFTRFVDANASILTQSIAIGGRSVSYYSGDIDKERFIFNCSYRNAGYMVFEGVREDYAGWLENNSLDDIVLELSGWPLVFRTDKRSVYANPTRGSR